MLMFFIPRMIAEDLTWSDFEQIQGQGSVKREAKGSDLLLSTSAPVERTAREGQRVRVEIPFRRQR